MTRKRKSNPIITREKVACPPIYLHLCVEFRVEVLPEVGWWRSKGTGRGAPSLFRRTVPLQLYKLPSTSAYRDSNGVAYDYNQLQPPGFDDLPCFGQTVEQVFVQAFITQPAIKLRKPI